MTAVTNPRRIRALTFLLAVAAPLVMFAQTPALASDWEATLVRDGNVFGGTNPWGFMDLGSRTLFFATDGTSGASLWSTDGTTAGTTLIKDIDPTSAGSVLGPGIAIGSTAYFVADDGVHGSELWKSDGTAAGTVLVKDINPVGGSDIQEMIDYSGSLVFVATDGTTGHELWKSDGTAAGTTLLAELQPGSAPSGLARPKSLVVFGGQLFFNGNDGSSGFELWRTSLVPGTAAIVKDILPGSDSGAPQELTVAGGRLFFSARIGVGATRELWVSDGTGDGTTMVRDPSKDTYRPFGDLCCLGSSGSTLYFRASNGFAVDGSGVSTGEELWKSDGTDGGTRLVKDINPGPTGSMPLSFTSNGRGGVWFVANDGTHGLELWATDGSEAGTQMVKDIYPGTSGSTPFGSHWAVSGGWLLFGADDGANGVELWESDGTALGTSLVTDINPGPSGSYPLSLTVVSGTVFFSASDSGTIAFGTNRELWKATSPAPVLPVLSIDDVFIAEGDSGAVDATFTVTLSTASTSSVSVDYITMDGTATAGSDYVATGGTIDFVPGETVATVSVSVLGDLVAESDETFTFDLSNPINATIGDGQGVGTIIDDDALSDIEHDVGIAGGGFRTSKRGTMGSTYALVVKVKNFGDVAEDIAYVVTSDVPHDVFSAGCGGTIMGVEPRRAVQVGGCTVTYGGLTGNRTLTVTVLHDEADGGIDRDPSNNARNTQVTVNP